MEHQHGNSEGSKKKGDPCPVLSYSALASAFVLEVLHMSVGMYNYLHFRAPDRPQETGGSAAACISRLVGENASVSLMNYRQDESLGKRRWHSQPS